MPTQLGTWEFTVEVARDPGGSADQALHIEIWDTLEVTTTSLPNGIDHSSYYQPLTASGGDLRRTWALKSGSLPPGISLSQFLSSYAIIGQTTTAGTWDFEVEVSSVDGQKASRALSLTIEYPPWEAFRRGDLVLGRLVRSPCPMPGGTWYIGRLAPEDPTLIDLHYVHVGPTITHATLDSADVAEVAVSGAQIVRLFHTGVIRVLAQRSQLGALTPSWARAVPDPNRVDVSVLVGHDGSGGARAYFEGLGGVVTSGEDVLIPWFAGVISDDRIPELRAHPSVTHTEPNWIGCLID
jgi:hypothetical protein